MIKYDESPEKNDPLNSRRRNRSGDSRTLVGIILVAIGAVLIAGNYKLLPTELSEHLISLPMLLIVIGIFNLVRRAYTPALLLISIGLFFFIEKFNCFPEIFSQKNFWPALIILVGISFILQWRRPHHHDHFLNVGRDDKKSTDFIDETAIFGGRNISMVTEHFQGGKITSIFGGSKVNLLYAKPVDGCTIDVAAIFGGTKIIVPEDWNVKIEVVSIFGGFEDKRSFSVISRTGTGKIVVIKGTCIFGGGEVTTMP
jgi:predicted membrane protein